MKPVYADFQNLDDENRLRLTCAGTRRDIEQQGIELREGMVLTLYTDDATDDGQPSAILARGIIHFNQAENCWVAEIDREPTFPCQICGVRYKSSELFDVKESVPGGCKVTCRQCISRLEWEGKYLTRRSSDE